jgi:hypothetical protein
MNKLCDAGAVPPGNARGRTLRRHHLAIIGETARSEWVPNNNQEYLRVVAPLTPVPIMTSPNPRGFSWRHPG